MKRLLSIFDYSGAWALPFYRAGWDVVQWDIKLDDFMDVMRLDSVETCLEIFEYVDGVLCAIPCTEFAVSGSRWWAAKDKDGRTARALAIAQQALKVCELFIPTDPDFNDTFFYAIENPVGRLARLTGLGDAWYFDPCEFAGYTNPSPAVLAELDRIRAKNGANITFEEFELILETNAYTKKTGLWGGFNTNLIKKPIAPVKGSPQGSPMQRLGGKSDLTKELRSNTPAGFAQAFYDANKDYCYNPSTVS
jgi:hypothetical protein